MKARIRKVISTSAFRLIFIVIIVILPINVLTLVLSSTTVDEVESQIPMEVKNALDLYMTQIDGALERIMMKVHSVALEDSDFARLNQKAVTDKKEHYRQLQSAVNLNVVLKEVREDNAWITGVFTYFPKKEIQLFNSQYTTYNSSLMEYIKEQVENTKSDAMKKWKVVKIDGNSLLVFLANYKQAYYGGWIDLRLLANSLDLNAQEKQDTVQAFTDNSGAIHYSNREDLTNLELNQPYKKYDGKGYVLIEAEAKYADLHLIQIISKSELSSSLPGMIRVLQVASVLALCILPIIIISLKKWMLTPLHQLSRAMHKIENGKMEFRITEQNSGSEFEQINRNFNHMMDQVSNLKISIYEQQLEKQQIKMRFLCQQMQPHFILNAMNILYSYEQEEFPLIQKMILCLAKYFRYVVNANSDFVKLHEEMKHIQNYFEIQQTRYPKTFFAMVEFDEGLEDCLVPPLLIQNFAENAIKHSLQIGNSIDIFVIAQKYQENYLRIRLVDTGEGIKEEVLKKIKAFRETRKYQDNLGVGIQNAIERIEIFYGGVGSVEISREEPHGTRVEIVLPLHRDLANYKGNIWSEQ